MRAAKTQQTFKIEPLPVLDVVVFVYDPLT